MHVTIVIKVVEELVYKKGPQEKHIQELVEGNDTGVLHKSN